MANSYCEDCGCAVYSGLCTNCHETLYIKQQYEEQNIPLPDPHSQFMIEVRDQEADVATKRERYVGTTAKSNKYI